MLKQFEYISTLIKVKYMRKHCDVAMANALKLAKFGA